MNFNKKALVKYAQTGMDKRPDGILIIAYFFFICLCGFFLIFNHCSVFTIILAVVSILSYIALTLVLLGKYSLTHGYNFLWMSVSSLILSLNMLTLSSYLMYTLTSQAWYIVVSVAVYIICACLFYSLIVFRLSKLKPDDIDCSRNGLSTSFALPSVLPTILVLKEFMLSNPQIRDVFSVFTFIVLFVGSVLLIMATGVIIKFLILKKLK